MSLFTGKGDNGTTKTFGCDQRISKSSAIAEALGTLDEVNSFLGIAKVVSAQKQFKFQDRAFEEIVHFAQQNLFIIQAEVAGAEKRIEAVKVTELEDIINGIEKEMPPIKTFFISGGTELGAVFDVCRTLARRAERRVVGVHDEGIRPLGDSTLAYLNRLSSLLYALARYTNHLEGIVEEAPNYR